MQAALRPPRCTSLHRSIERSCRHTQPPLCAPRYLSCLQRQAPRGSVYTRSFFDGIKNMFSGPGSSSNSAGDKAGSGPGANPEDEEEGAEMMRLDSESGGLAQDESAFGPLAVLLVGFMAEEVEAFRRFMLEMEADMVKIVPCSPAMMAGTLQQALESEFPKYEQPPLGTRRTVFLSGMIGPEIMEVIGAYRDAGLPPTVWAAAVPNNFGRQVKELVEEVNAENAEMRRRAMEAAERQALEEGAQMQ